MNQRLMLILGFACILAACNVPPVVNQPIPIATSQTSNASLTATRDLTEIDRCAQQATTQLDINKCAAKQRDEAARQLEDVVKQVQAQYNADTRYAYLTEVSPQATTIPPETFWQLQSDWKTWAERECTFRYGRIISDTTGLQYENGTRSPMLVASCEAAKYKQRAEELRRLYRDKQ